MSALRLKYFMIRILPGILLLGLMTGFPAFAQGDTSYRNVNTEVSSSARKKYTKKKGSGKDKVTIMVYMIGSDLESQGGMATSDLNEMLYAQLDNKKLNLFVQTGGCKRWRNSLMTAGKIQRWKMDGNALITALIKISTRIVGNSRGLN